MKLRTRPVSTPKLAAFSWIDRADPTSSAAGASPMNRSMPPFSSPSQCRSTRFASVAGSSTSRIAARMFSKRKWSPVWTSVGRSSSIRNWLKVIPYASVIVEMR